MATINVAKQFTRYPSGRKSKHGTTSGEEFRNKFLIPCLRKREKITIELDGTIGYGSSFLEEAFGGAVRETNMRPDEVLSLLELITSDTALKNEIVEYINAAGQRV